MNKTDSLQVADTPMLRQYKEIKAQHKEDILFFRLGDFYEMFLDDAQIASRELDITLTGRGKHEKRIPMCGIPYHAADNYITKLVNKGYRVAICDQVEDAALAKGLTRREVVKIVTPGTLSGAGVLDEKENNYLVAVNKLEKEQGYGISYVDISTGEFKILIVENKTELLAEIDKLAVREVLAPEGFVLAGPEQVLQTIYYPLEKDRAAQELAIHFQVNALTGFGLEGLEEAYTSAWAIIEYLRKTQKHSLPQITKLEAIYKDNVLFMDKVTIKNLELTEAFNTNERQASLLGVLDKTKTAMGARKLKNLLKKPFLEIDIINKRLDSVDVLMKDLLSREEIREVLAKVYDLERLIARIVSERNNPRDCLALKDSLLALADLADILIHLESDVLKDYADYFADFVKKDSCFTQIITLIKNSINENCPININENGVIKQGYDEKLDELILEFKDIRKWITGLEESEKKRTDIKNLKVRFNKVFGYYIEISNSYKDRAPENYIRKQTLTNAERFITPELKEKESVLLNGEERQKNLERQIFEKIVNQLREYVAPLQELAQVVGDIDVLQSLATVSVQSNYTRPELVARSKLVLKIKQGRHPVLEKNAAVHFIANDIDIDEHQNRFILITGPNMAGKSTIMRQVALLVVLAQIGCFVPAETASISIVDKLFTRIGALDNLYFGQSTFMVEMLETASILNNATSSSLILLDEIGRGTSTFDGMSIAHSVAEYIHQKIGARTFFATHYHELTILEKMYEAFSNFNMQIVEAEDKVIFKYKFNKGTADKSYGIHVAKMAGLPQEVVDKASLILSGFEREGLDYLKNKDQNNQLALF
jgi:DNA mismatch repair protein MutS